MEVIFQRWPWNQADDFESAMDMMGSHAFKIYYSGTDTADCWIFLQLMLKYV